MIKGGYVPKSHGVGIGYICRSIESKRTAKQAKREREMIDAENYHRGYGGPSAKEFKRQIMRRLKNDKVVDVVTDSEHSG